MTGSRIGPIGPFSVGLMGENSKLALELKEVANSTEVFAILIGPGEISENKWVGVAEMFTSGMELKPSLALRLWIYRAFNAYDSWDIVLFDKGVETISL